MLKNKIKLYNCIINSQQSQKQAVNLQNNNNFFQNNSNLYSKKNIQLNINV